MPHGGGGDVPARYFDTCALILRYIPGPASERVDELLASPGPHFTCRLGEVEMHSAAANYVRKGEISRLDFSLAMDVFKRDVADGLVKVVSVKNPRYSDAARLIGRYGLDGELGSQDAVHLAVALSLQACHPGLALVTLDVRLQTAAALVAMPVVVP